MSGRLRRVDARKRRQFILVLDMKDCWISHWTIDSWFEPAPARTLAELIENYEQKNLPISEFFPHNAFHCDLVHLQQLNQIILHYLIPLNSMNMRRGMLVSQQ